MTTFVTVGKKRFFFNKQNGILKPQYGCADICDIQLAKLNRLRKKAVKNQEFP